MQKPPNKNAEKQPESTPNKTTFFSAPADRTPDITPLTASERLKRTMQKDWSSILVAQQARLDRDKGLPEEGEDSRKQPGSGPIKAR